MQTFGHPSSAKTCSWSPRPPDACAPRRWRTAARSPPPPLAPARACPRLPSAFPAPPRAPRRRRSSSLGDCRPSPRQRARRSGNPLASGHPDPRRSRRTPEAANREEVGHLAKHPDHSACLSDASKCPLSPARTWQASTCDPSAQAPPTPSPFCRARRPDPQALHRQALCLKALARRQVVPPTPPWAARWRWRVRRPSLGLARQVPAHSVRRQG
mmetsp:Transcript_42527/g.108055  ORF Transcript_42527/g.108055 Transcript_42527/m.108055 type:complete len:214 (-) Transcript_42527:389-1030(-)